MASQPMYTHSNTTLVKVKSDFIDYFNKTIDNSNTTLVKVKWICLFLIYLNMPNSNTTLVKVKSQTSWGDWLTRKAFKYNSC